MEQPVEQPTPVHIDVITEAQHIADWTDKLIREATLTATQQADLDAVAEAAQNFITYARKEWDTIQTETTIADKQRVRHQLRNYLNIVVGFSRLLVKELPDNLLLHMATVRKIHATGNKLMAHIDSIQ